jgi:hypothetical protein
MNGFVFPVGFSVLLSFMAEELIGDNHIEEAEIMVQ